MPKVKNENYYTIFGWMLNELHLKGNDLKIYALIYGFSQDGESEYKGSLSYLKEFGGVSQATLIRSLERLESLGYVVKIARNATTGLTNIYKAVSPETFFNGKGGGCQNDNPPPVKMTTPPVKMTTPPVKMTTDNNTNIDSNSDSCIEKERKKENKKTINLDFSKMTDEELIDWGHKPPDFSIENYWELFNAYVEEMRRRGTGQKWKGKIIRTEGKIEHLKSHSDIMKEWGVSSELQSALTDFLIHCYANKHLISNRTLEDIIFRLEQWYGEDDDKKVKSVRLAISSGYYDIREFRGQKAI
ncbi:MAG: helix-turn-helix domain-containing protein [Candidatus Coproplasma sp.]